eukprot:3693947-Lingulodinium_polyedra.AAC.1
MAFVGGEEMSTDKEVRMQTTLARWLLSCQMDIAGSPHCQPWDTSARSMFRISWAGMAKSKAVPKVAKRP